MNLLTETIKAIEENGHTPEQIVFIGSVESGHACTWDNFTELANKDYDSGYGSQKVAQDLIVVFSDGSIMRRIEYDGAEEWEYYQAFVMPENTKPILSVFAKGVGGETLSDINDTRPDAD